MKTARWYFDFISPYSYLQHTVLTRFEGLVQIEPVPILFAGLLVGASQAWKSPAVLTGLLLAPAAIALNTTAMGKARG